MWSQISDRVVVPGVGVDAGHGRPVLGHQLLQEILVTRVCVVLAGHLDRGERVRSASIIITAITHLGALVVGLQAGGAGQLGRLVEVGVGGLVGEAQPGVSSGLQVGVGPGSVAPCNHPLKQTGLVR